MAKRFRPAVHHVVLGAGRGFHVVGIVTLESLDKGRAQPRLQKRVHHMVEWMEADDGWRFTENEFRLMREASEPEEWFREEEEESSEEEERSEEEEDERMRESLAAPSGGRWSPIRPP